MQKTKEFSKAKPKTPSFNRSAPKGKKATARKSLSPLRKNKGSGKIFVMVACAAAAITILGLYELSLVSSRNIQPATAQPTELNAPAVITLDTIYVQRFLVPQHTEFVGRIRKVPTVEIKPKVEGIVANILPQVGDVVNEGDLLYEINAASHRNDIARLTADAASLTERIRLLSEVFERISTLVEHEVFQPDDPNISREAINVRLEEARQELGSINAEIASAQQQLQYTKVISSATGAIVDLGVTEGASINLQNPPIIEIASSGTAQALVRVPVSQAIAIFHAASYASQDSEATTALNPVPVQVRGEKASEFQYTGLLSPTDVGEIGADATTLLMMTIPQFDGKLGLGSSIFVRFSEPLSDTSILVPKRAVEAVDIAEENRGYAYIISESGSLERRDVEISEYDNASVIIKSGLKVGQTLVTDIAMVSEIPSGSVIDTRLVKFQPVP